MVENIFFSILYHNQVWNQFVYFYNISEICPFISSPIARTRIGALIKSQNSKLFTDFSVFTPALPTLQSMPYLLLDWALDKSGHAILSFSFSEVSNGIPSVWYSYLSIIGSRPTSHSDSASVNNYLNISTLT